MGGIGSKGRTGVRGAALVQMGEAGGIREAAAPVTREYMGQMLEALRTGGVQAQLPMVQQAMEQSKLATSNALRQTSEGLYGAGLSNTPWGQQILAEQRQAGGQAVAGIGPAFAQGLIEQAPGMILGEQGMFAGLMGQAQQGQAQQRAFRMAAEQQTNSFIGSIIGSLLGGVGGGKGGGSGGGSKG